MRDRFGIQLITIIMLATFGIFPASSQAAVQVKLETSQGTILLELYDEKAPQTVANFLQYVKEGFFENTVFHRVIRGFMIQGGGLTPELQKKKTRSPIPNEANNGLKNKKGTIAMARTMAPHSASSQFFINTKDNDFLDFKSQTQQGWGYCVFGRVIGGMETVDRIETVTTVNKAGRQDVPKVPIVIQRATVVEKEPQ